MPVPRRDFMKLFGVSLGSLLLARCQRTGTPEPTFVMCYAAIPYTPASGTPAPAHLASVNRLRLCWLRFGELAQKTLDGTNAGEDAGDPLGTQMIAEHRAAIDELAASGEISVPVADLIQEAYAAAVYHVWRSNAPMTCYDMMYPEYAPASAENLVQQADVLMQVASGGTIAPETVAKTQTALEHDLAFYALTDADVQALYDRLVEEYSDPGKAIPSFDEVELTLTPDAKEAAEFLLDVIRGL